MRKLIWNDRAFKRWVREGAKARGMPVHEILKAAGVNKYYLNENAEGRSTNVVLNLAEVLELSPAPLFGTASLRLWETKMHEATVPHTDRLVLTARLMAIQMATFIYVASGQEGSDPTALMRLVLQELNRAYDDQHTANDSEPDNTEKTAPL